MDMKQRTPDRRQAAHHRLLAQILWLIRRGAACAVLLLALVVLTALLVASLARDARGRGGILLGLDVRRRRAESVAVW